MPLTRTQKKDIISEVNTTLKSAQALILVQNKGMTVAEVSELRRRMRAAGGNYRVVKNRLAKLAVKDQGDGGLSPRERAALRRKKKHR